MVREDLEALSKEELIELILAQAEQLAQLQAAFRQLQADHEALKKKFEHNQKPPISSQPPSRDQKGSMPKERRKRRHGPPAAHPKHERQFVANPDQVVVVRTGHCPDCRADLSEEDGLLVGVNQITELPVSKAEVIEVRQYALTCPQCGGQHVAQPPEGLEIGRVFGAWKRWWCITARNSTSDINAPSGRCGICMGSVSARATLTRSCSERASRRSRWSNGSKSSCAAVR